MKLHKRLAFVLTLLGMFVFFPFAESEAQSADMVVSELSCDKLYSLAWEEMDGREKDYSLRCDAQQADEQWNALYGGMSGQEKLSAVVLE